ERPAPQLLGSHAPVRPRQTADEALAHVLGGWQLQLLRRERASGGRRSLPDRRTRHAADGRLDLDLPRLRRPADPRPGPAGGMWEPRVPRRPWMGLERRLPGPALDPGDDRSAR